MLIQNNYMSAAPRFKGMKELPTRSVLECMTSYITKESEKDSSTLRKTLAKIFDWTPKNIETIDPFNFFLSFSSAGRIIVEKNAKLPKLREAINQLPSINKKDIPYFISKYENKIGKKIKIYI